LTRKRRNYRILTEHKGIALPRAYPLVVDAECAKIDDGAAGYDGHQVSILSVITLCFALKEESLISPEDARSRNWKRIGERPDVNAASQKLIDVFLPERTTVFPICAGLHHTTSWSQQRAARLATTSAMDKWTEYRPAR
jgi:hypothetical protein